MPTLSSPQRQGQPEDSWCSFSISWILEKSHQTAQRTFSGAQVSLLCMAAPTACMGSIILSKRGRLGVQTQESMANERNFDQNSNPTQPPAICRAACILLERFFSLFFFFQNRNTKKALGMREVNRHTAFQRFNLISFSLASVICFSRSCGPLRNFSFSPFRCSVMQC